jgi:predicted cupin superfamily sugar epimerase
MLTVEQLIQHFNLQPHPEGGYYQETYKSTELIIKEHLPDRFKGNRHFSTAIYFLLQQGDFSAFHRIQSDECWHFYAGQTLFIYILHCGGQLEIVQLGNNIAEGEVFQYVVPAGTWFASEPAPGSAFSFMGCTVAPGFDFADFEMATVEGLQKIYPQHAAVINRLSR